MNKDYKEIYHAKAELRAIVDNIRYALHSLISGGDVPSKKQVKEHLIQNIDAFFLDNEKHDEDEK